MTAYEDKPDHHRHQCTECGFVWEHRTLLASEDMPLGYHTCPGCKARHQTARYDGPDAPDPLPRKRGEA